MTEVLVPPPAPRALGIVLRYRLLAFRHQLAGLVIHGRPSAAGPRVGQAGPQGSAVPVLLALGFLLVSGAIGRATALAMQTFAVASGAVPPNWVSSAPWSLAHAGGIAAAVGLVLVALLGIGVGLRDPRLLRARVESLAVLPVAPVLGLAVEVAERAVGNPLLWLAAWPLLSAALITWDWGYAAFALAALILAVHAVTLAAVEFAVAVALQRLPAAWAGTMRAAMLALGLLAPLAATAVLAALAGPPDQVDPLVVSVLRAVSPLALGSPAGFGLLIAQGRAGGMGLALPLLTTLGVWAAAAVLIHRLAAGGMESLASGSGTRARRPTRSAPFVPGLIGEELAALARDRVGLAVHVVVPLVALGVQAWQVRRGGPVPESLPRVLPLLVAALLAAPAALVLARMGDGVWLVFMGRRSVDRYVAERAAVWGGLGFAGGVLALLLLAPPDPLPTALALVVGLPAFTVASAALGILGVAPGSNPHRRLRSEEAIAQIAFAIPLAAAAVAPERERPLILLGLIGLAAALWGRARGHLPWALDPGGRDPRPVDAADGLKAFLLFVAIQLLVASSIKGASFWGYVPSPAAIIQISGALAWTMAVALTVDPLVKQGLPLRAILPLGSPSSPIRSAVLPGVVFGLFSAAYLTACALLLQHRLTVGVPADWTHPMTAAIREHPWRVAFAPLVLAPLGEETTFRALLYGGLRSSLGPRTAMLLSAIAFGVIHPPIYALPTIGVGLVFAWLYERTRGLAAPMLAHAVTNACGMLAIVYL